MSPARIEANRRNAQKSTGPRTAWGKAQSRMNSLRTGGRSAFHQNFILLLLGAPPCSGDRVARALLTPEQAAHPMFRETVEMFRRAESEVVAQSLYQPAMGRRPKKKIPFLFGEGSLNVIENTVWWFKSCHYVIENNGR
jgi:hypothetical protein